jgi:hypothetical protein
MTQLVSEPVRKIIQTPSFRAPPTRGIINPAQFIRPAKITEPEPRIVESDESILARIRERFTVMDDLVGMSINGKARALVISGPAGVGKSYTVKRHLKHIPDERYTVSTGFIRATGLYRLLYNHRGKDQIIIFDDSDTLFLVEDSLNLLKNALDTNDERIISWRAETNMKDDAGDPLPTEFLFEGSMIFITNKDFDAMIANQDKFSVHYEAFISRSYYIDLAMRNRRDYLIRIKDVIDNEGMLTDKLNSDQIKDVLSYIETNLYTLREVSLRIAGKIAGIMNEFPNSWERNCNVTCRKAQ